MQRIFSPARKHADKSDADKLSADLDNTQLNEVRARFLYEIGREERANEIYRARRVRRLGAF